MATTVTRHDECLAERDEVLFPQTNMIDTEPFRRNLLRRKRYQPNSSPTINGYIYNLIRIVEDIGYHPRSPFLHTPRSVRLIKKTTQKSDDDNQSNIYTFIPECEFDDLETISSTSTLEPIDDAKLKQQVTIREYYSGKDISSLMVNRSVLSSLSSQQTTEDIDYSELLNDPNPEIITKPNPNQITYQQNVSVRYLVPPTPPPPGPLIIREIISPRSSTPSPLIIKQQEPPPPTPSPIIFREAPPTPPIQRVPPLPPKPQSIIIEKWLPYKPQPPREIIYERLIEAPVISQFQPDCLPFVQRLTTPALVVHHPPVTRTAMFYQPTLFYPIF